MRSIWLEQRAVELISRVRHNELSNTIISLVQTSKTGEISYQTHLRYKCKCTRYNYNISYIIYIYMKNICD